MNPALLKSKWSLEKLLLPFDELTFLSQVLSRGYLHVPGDPTKFKELFSWASLNRILAGTAITSPQLRVTTGTVEESPRSFFRDSNGIPVLCSSELNRILLNRTLLTIDSLEEVDAQVADFCCGIEAGIGFPILQAQMHATFSAAAGPGLRSNDHDMFVLQIAGSKTWMLYGCTKGERYGPDTDPVWSQILSAGDLLYVPRNWWYVEKSFEPAAVHLGIAFRNPTGIDFAARVMESLSSSELMTADYPLFQGGEAQADYLANFQREISDAFARPGLIRGYFNDLRTLAKPKRISALPWSVLDAESLPMNCTIISTMRFPAAELRLRSRIENVIEVTHEGNAIRASDRLEPVLSRIFDDGSCSVQSLLDSFERDIPRELIIALLIDLLRLGAIAAIVPPTLS